MFKQTFDFTDEDKQILDKLKEQTGLPYVGLIRKMIRHYDSGGDVVGLIKLKKGTK